MVGSYAPKVLPYYAKPGQLALAATCYQWADKVVLDGGIYVDRLVGFIHWAAPRKRWEIC